MLGTYVYPKWGNRPFLEIRRRDINDLLDHVEDKHGQRQAGAVLSTLRSIMTWHHARDEHYTMPIVKGMQRGKSQARDRILDDNEIRALWRVAGAMAGHSAPFWKILLLTAQRFGKVAGMRWDDIREGFGQSVRSHARRDRPQHKFPAMSPRCRRSREAPSKRS